MKMFSRFKLPLEQSANPPIFKVISLNVVSEKTAVDFDEHLSPEDDDLYVKIRWYLIFGRIIGLVPCTGVFQKDVHSFKYKFLTVAAFVTLIGALMVGTSCFICFIGMFNVHKRNASEIALAAATPVFYAYAFFLFSYFYLNGEKFTKLFDTSKYKFYFAQKDPTLSRDVGIIAGLIFTSAISENIAWSMQFFPVHGPSDIPNEPVLETYYKRSHTYWADLIHYHVVWGMFVFITNKLALYAWNYVDICIVIVARTVYFKFRKLAEEAERITMLGINELQSQPDFKTFLTSHWTHLIRDHLKVCQILDQFQQFFSPLIFFSFAKNIFWTCLKLFLELSPSNPTKVEAIYKSWAFLHLLVRIFIVSIYSSRINTYAHNIGRSLEKCPDHYLTPEIRRFETRLNSRDIALNGLGCFAVTKSFVLGMMGVIISFEIILLQTLPVLCKNV